MRRQDLFAHIVDDLVIKTIQRLERARKEEAKADGEQSALWRE